MGITTICSKQTSEPRKRVKRVKRLKSVKVANLQERSRLSLKLKKSGYLIVQQPNYMNPTSCSDAKREPNPGDVSIQTTSVKRIYSLKRPRNMCARSRLSFADNKSSIMLEEAVDDTMEPNIQLTRLKSVKVSTRRWSHSRFNQASIFRTDNEASGSGQVSVDTTSHNPTKEAISNSAYAGGVRRLWKIPRQRHRRKVQQSQVGFDLATCSSTIKSSKFPQLCPYTHCSVHGSSPPLQKRPSLKSRSRRYKSITDARVSNVTHPEVGEFNARPRQNPTYSQPIASFMMNNVKGGRHHYGKTHQRRSSVTESTTDILSRNQNYTNMWNLIYTNSLAHANEATKSTSFNHEHKHSEKNDDAHLVAETEFNHAEAIEFVQQAVDGILLLDTRDSLEQPLMDGDSTEGDKPDEAMESANSPERQNSTAMRQTSKGFQKIRKIIATTKFIKAMEKVRKMNPQKPQHLYLGAERVYLRHWSMDERKNSEEWMLDYALQEVIAKLAPAQRKKVEMLTHAFETFSSDLQQVGTGKVCFPEKMPPAYSIASSTTNEDEQHKSVVVKDPSVYKDDFQKPDDQVLSMLEDALAFSIKQQDSISEDFDTEFDMELYEDNSELSGINLHIHDQGGTKGCPVCYPHSFSKEGKEENTKHIINSSSRDIQSDKAFTEESSQSQDLGDDGFYDCNEIFLDENKYTSMWNLIYKHVKSGIPEQVQCGIDANEQAKKDDAEIQDHERTSCKLLQSSSNSDMEIQGSNHNDTKLQQKDAIKLVQDVVEEILQMSDHPSDDQLIIEEYKTEKTKDGTQQQLPRYSNTVSKVILCKKFIKAMEKKKKQHSKVGRYIPRQPPSTVESTHIKQQKENEINCDQLMLDFALQQVIGNLGPAKKNKVSLLVEAFERVVVPPEARAHQQLNFR